MSQKPKKPRCLFICKKRIDSYGVSYGLLNSATFVVNALNEEGFESKLVSVSDNNCIDREINAFKPDFCFIEAIWVVPDKFEVLCKLHPKVQFIVRIHSKTPFLAMEGIAIDWIKRYAAVGKTFKNLHVSANSLSLNEDLIGILGVNSILLPNVYMPVKPSICPMEEVEYDNQPSFREMTPERGKVINVGCFGAIRPLKNHLIQAMAAIAFGEKNGCKIRFHINGNRLEQQGSQNILKNMRALYAGTKHELVEHAWMPHAEFIELIKTMDIGMQVSLSESFNIVVADFIANDIPIVASPDVDWISSLSQADPNSTDDIVKKLGRAWRGKLYNLQRVNRDALSQHNKHALKTWLRFLL